MNRYRSKVLRSPIIIKHYKFTVNNILRCIAEQTNQLLQNLEKIPHVIGLSVQCGASIKPKGNVLTVHTLNRGADEVMKVAQATEKYGSQLESNVRRP